MVDIKPYHVVADGFSEISIARHVPEHHSSVNRRALDAFVVEKERQAVDNGGTFYNGSMVGIPLGSIRPDGYSLKFDTQDMDYASHAALFRENPQSAIQAAYVSAIVITKDNYLVLGKSQATEAQWMGKMNIIAGGLERIAGDAFPSLSGNVVKELAEEIGFAGELDADVDTIVPAFMLGMSKREGMYHFTVPHVVMHNLTSKELSEYFNDWKSLKERYGNKVEFAELGTLPNDPKKLLSYITEQDSLGEKSPINGRALDIYQEWASEYNCDPSILEERKKEGTKIYLPQPVI